LNKANLPSPSGELSIAVIRYRPGETHAAHAHSTASVAVILAGHVAERAGGSSVEHGLGGLAIKPAGVEHDNRFGAGGAVMLAIKGDLTPNDWRWRRGNGFARLGIDAARQLAGGDPFGLAHEAAHQLLAAANDLALPEPAAVATPWLARIRDRVAASPGRPPLAALARSAGVHPVYLTRAFRRAYGCSIGEFVRGLRIERAAHRLAHSTDSVCAVAMRLGFADQSHFCRTFRIELGVAPSIYRSLMRT
jgi:AraC family transcriptional regulator